METLTPAPKKQPKPTIPAKVKRAIDALLNGDAKTVTKAAEIVGCSRPYLSTALGRPHVVTYFQERVARSMMLTAAPAAARVAQLIDSARSEHVALKASEYALGSMGIGPKTGPQVAINFGLPTAGYVLNLRDTDGFGEVINSATGTREVIHRDGAREIVRIGTGELIHSDAIEPPKLTIVKQDD